MKLKDSTFTRVKPLFDFIGNDMGKLNKFFYLFNDDIPETKQGSIKEIRYGKKEKLIPPSKSLLTWLLYNYKELTLVKDYGVKNKKSDTYLKREKLFEGDKETFNDALSLISTKNPLPKSAWYIFEGHTHPDIYIETDDSIFVGEAKRTEPDITTTTDWLNPRDQLVRHIDSLLDQPKKIYSFYLLDRKEFQKGVYPKRMELYKSYDYFKMNLRHRKDTDNRRAMESFIGYTFWEDIADCFKINFPDTIKDLN